SNRLRPASSVCRGSHSASGGRADGAARAGDGGGSGRARTVLHRAAHPGDRGDDRGVQQTAPGGGETFARKGTPADPPSEVACGDSSAPGRRLAGRQARCPGDSVAQQLVERRLLEVVAVSERGVKDTTPELRAVDPGDRLR